MLQKPYPISLGLILLIHKAGRGRLSTYNLAFQPPGKYIRLVASLHQATLFSCFQLRQQKHPFFHHGSHHISFHERVIENHKRVKKLCYQK